MTELILHHYASSPFSEKVRLILGYKRLNWSSVTVPVIAPKPDVVALTGGYRNHEAYGALKKFFRHFAWQLFDREGAVRDGPLLGTVAHHEQISRRRCFPRSGGQC